MADAILRAEISGDPQARGYGTMTDAQILADMTDARIDNWVPLAGAQVVEAFDLSELATLSASDRANVDSVISLGEAISTEPGGIARQMVVNAFGTGSQTVTNLGTLANQKISRADQLGIAGWLNLVHVQEANS